MLVYVKNLEMVFEKSLMVLVIFSPTIDRAGVGSVRIIDARSPADMIGR